MSKAQDGVKVKKWSKHPMAKARRYTALKNLEIKLKNPQPSHTEKDISRMKKEVEILKERI